MKKLIFAILIILIILSVGVFEQVYLSNTLDELVNKTQNLKTTIENGEDALQQAYELNEWWIDVKHSIEAMSPHNDLKDVTAQLAELVGNVENDETEQALTRTTIMVNLTLNLKNLLGFHWEHIF